MASSGDTPFTKYTYKPLPSPRHIRLLCITKPSINDSQESPDFSFSLADFEIPENATILDFEAISYQWGHPARVQRLHIEGEEGSMGLTANLAEALPHLIKKSRTGRLWIDQLCINQSSPTEKATQISLMSLIYTLASRVLVWLGPADTHSLTCAQWLQTLATLIPTLQSARKITIGSPEYSRSWRQIVVADTFNSPGTSPIWANAIARFWSRKWWTRGWVVQEFLLAREVLCLTGDVEFTLQDLDDMFARPVPTVNAASEVLDQTDGSSSFRILMSLKTDPFTETLQPQLFLRIMAAVAQEFVTQELGDRLYGFLGMLPGLQFKPDYSQPLRNEFTRFAATLARQYGSLDFLSLWSSNLDSMLKDTPEELLGFPSWVPSFQWLPLTAPWRLAVGTVRSWRSVIRWNAAQRRRHIHNQTEDAATSKKLHVRGKVVDYISAISTARIAQFEDTDEAYHTSLVTQIQRDLPGFETWTQVDLIHFLNVASCNGNTPRESAEQLLGLASSLFPEESRHLHRYAESLACCLHMGRGRRFVVTEKGRKGLAPFIGSVGREGERRGSAVVVLHGCIVPMVLQRVYGGEENEGGCWTVVGDAYVEGLMLGEGVEWAEEDAESFVLV